MFDSLLNSKFYNKCKHAIKCTRTRLNLPRGKKQAMVKILKKDVAVLLTDGFESHAFARMEGLIVEMNQASCYDMIEQHCEYIVKLLNHMQKESECPQEALESVSTLIFAAARFPDLPELCDLRHIFTEKYGSSVEPFVNSEFVQNLQSKSFTDEEKLRVMKRVAEEFSVPFDSRALEWKITCGSQNKHDLPKKSSLKQEMEASARDGHKVDRHAVHERKTKAMPEGYEQKQEQNVKPKDIHVVPDGIGQLGEKSRKKYSDKPSEKRHMDNPLPPLDMKEKNGQKEMKKYDKKDSHHRRELMDAEVLDLNGLKKQDVGVVKFSGGPDRSWGHADLGLKTLGLEKEEIDSTCTLNGKTVNKAPPYSKPYRVSMGEKVAEDRQDRQPVPEKAANMRPPYVKPNFEKHANQGANAYKHSGAEEIGHQKREPIYDPVSVRSRIPKPPAHVDDYAGMANVEKMANQAPDGRRRHSSKRNGAYDNYDHKGGHVLPIEGMGVDDDINNARPFHRIPSERRKHRSRRNGSTSGSDYNGASNTLLGDSPMNTNRIIQWAEYEIETFARLVKENSPLPESVSALRSACICIETSLHHCSCLESQGLKFSKLLMVLLRLYIEQILDLNFRRVRRKIVDGARNDDILLVTPQEGSPLSGPVSPNVMLTSSGKKFMSIVNDVLDQILPMTIVHFGGAILNKFLQHFDRYVETLIKVLPGPSEDDNLLESKEPVEFKAESDAQQLTLIGTAYTVADELLPAAVTKFFDMQAEKKGAGGSSEGLGPGSIYAMEYKEWKRNLQHSSDKLRDHFCRQYVLSFIYLEGKSRLDAKMYLGRKDDDLLSDPDPLPSLPFQALFGRLQQLASVAGDVLLGKDKLQKVLFSRLIETVIMWLSNEQEFWDVFEDRSVQLQPSGLQQLILDMHFIVEIAVCGRFPHRPVQQLVSTIITRAVAAFSARGVDPQSVLPEDEWFVDTAKAAIHKLMLGNSGSESEPEPEVEEHIALHGEISDSEESSTPSTAGSEDSFASAKNDDLESPVYFTDPES